MDDTTEPVSYGATDTTDEQAKHQETGDNAEQHVQEEDAFVTIEVDDRDTQVPTLAPIGSRLKRNAQIAYNPFDWKHTTCVVRGRPSVTSAYYIVALLGAVLVFISARAMFRAPHRTCRAWCTVFSLSTEPHQYMGFILFLLMSLRMSNSYRNYVAGQHAFYAIKTTIRVFTSALLSMTARDAVSRNRRARMLAYVICFPFALTSELRMERHFDKEALKNIVSDADLDKIMEAPSMSQYILESLSTMVRLYIPKEDVLTRKVLHGAIAALYKPYGEAERIQFNPMGFAYVVHLRLLLLMYLTTLPLAFVEKLGYATVVVHLVITYALMSVEMLAVGVENPFGHEGSDLRLYQYNILMRDSVLESWEEWNRNMETGQEDEEAIASYDGFGSHEDTLDHESSKWFFF